MDDIYLDFSTDALKLGGWPFSRVQSSAKRFLSACAKSANCRRGCGLVMAFLLTP